jgi:hypothetical protein
MTCNGAVVGIGALGHPPDPAELTPDLGAAEIFVDAVPGPLVRALA